MSYTTGGLIQATDYNTLATRVRQIMGTGVGIRGYGQTVTSINDLSAGATVTGTQWASLIYITNRAIGHQSGAGSQLGSGGNIGTTAGSTITYYANVDTATTSVQTNANLYSASGTTTTGTVLQTQVIFGSGPGVTTANTLSFTRSLTWSSGDAARYFFNCGGIVRLVANATNVNGTLRSADLVTNWATNWAGAEIRGPGSLGVIGSGGAIAANSSVLGYWGMTTSEQYLAKVTSSNYRYEYNTDFTSVNVNVTGTNVGGNGDNGLAIRFTCNVSLAGKISGTDTSDFNDTVNVNMGLRFDVIQPETTYLTASWGTPTIA